MIDQEKIKELEKEVNKLKFRASQKGGELHDLVEDRLLLEFENLIPFAEETFQACKKWHEKNQELLQLKKE